MLNMLVLLFLRLVPPETWLRELVFLDTTKRCYTPGWCTALSDFRYLAFAAACKNHYRIYQGIYFTIVELTDIRNLILNWNWNFLHRCLRWKLYLIEKVQITSLFAAISDEAAQESIGNEVQRWLFNMNK